MIEKQSASHKIADDPLFDNEDAWQTADAFDALKLDDGVRREWNEKYSKNPAGFFTKDSEHELRNIPAARRLALLARASLHITVTPTLIKDHFSRFPEDQNAVAALILSNEGIAEDGITHTFFGITWGIIKESHDLSRLHGNRRNGGQFDEIFDRREIGPKFLLSNHQEGGSQLQEKFGAAADGYRAAAKKAHELAMRGAEPLDTSTVFSNDAYKQLPQSQKAELLRMCLDDMQFALVFDETFNSHFTKSRITEWNTRKKDVFSQGGQVDHDVAHSILYGSWQSQNTYQYEDDFFEREMSSTADTGGDIEEYAYQKLLLAVLKEFPKVTEDKDVNTDLLTEFWLKNRNPIFTNAVVNALKSQNPERAANSLLNALREDEINKSAIVHVLRHSSGKTVIKNIVEITKLLEVENTPEHFFIECCAALAKSGNLALSDVQGGDMSMLSGTSLRNNVRVVSQMQDVIEKVDGAKYPEEFVKGTLNNLNRQINSPHSRFYMFRWENALASLCSFEDRYLNTSDGKQLLSVYFGLFRTNPTLQGGKLGDAVLDHALEQESAKLRKSGNEHVPIIAHCGPDITTSPDKRYQLLQYYLKKGFCADSHFYTKHDEPVERFAISYNLLRNQKLTSLKSNFDVNSKDGNIKVVQIALEDDFPTEQLENNWLLTKYSKKDNAHEFVFEKTAA